MSRLQLTPDDLAHLITRAASPHLTRCTAAVASNRLHLTLHNIPTNLPLVSTLTATVSLQGALETADRIALHLHLESVLGPATFLVRPFLKQILTRLIPARLHSAVAVESATRITITPSKLPAGPVPLTELLHFTALNLPDAPFALTLTFQIKEPPP